MDVMEKLVELLNEVQETGVNEIPAGFGCTREYVKNEKVASHLIARGVTVQDNTEISDELLKQLRNAPLTVLHEEPTIELVQEWISVEDRLPEQGQEVIVYSGGVLKPTVFAYQFWNKNYDSWARITHWIPLPQPPKGE